MKTTMDQNAIALYAYLRWLNVTAEAGELPIEEFTQQVAAIDAEIDFGNKMGKSVALNVGNLVVDVATTRRGWSPTDENFKAMFTGNGANKIYRRRLIHEITAGILTTDVEEPIEIEAAYAFATKVTGPVMDFIQGTYRHYDSANATT